ncbi:MAG: stalk domain-containing protein [Firmicutes bacterium]|nr:stalk domain-containing protein [Bacillota bacterium]
MFKKVVMMFALAVSSVLFATLPTYASGIAVNVNGQPVIFDGQAPVIVDGRTLVPVRGVFEMLGFAVAWNGDTRQATLSNADYTVVLTIDSATFTVNGTPHTSEVPAQIIGGSTMLPLRAVLEPVGFDLGWQAETQLITVTSGTPQVAITPPTPQPTPQPSLEEVSEYVTIGGREISTSVTQLELTFGNISDLTPLARLTNLTRLDLAHNNISDLTPLAGLTNLTELNLNLNDISDLTPLAGLTNLTRLLLGGNNISDSDLTPLAGLTNLTELFLNDNNISDLTPLAGLTNLTDLSLLLNNVSDLTPLAGLTNLTWLHLSNNEEITDWSPVDHIDLVFGRPDDWVRQ